jgi:hypothetical protein
MKSMVRLSLIMLKEAEELTGISTSRDQQELNSRSVKEGFSFLTITLPMFEKHLLKCIEQGYIGPDDFPGWEKASGTPKFLGGFLSKIFTDTGVDRIVDKVGISPYHDYIVRVADDEKWSMAERRFFGVDEALVNLTDTFRLPEDMLNEYILALRIVRQITLLHSKVEMECKESRVEAAYQQYESTDREVRYIPFVTLLDLPIVPNG